LQNAAYHGAATELHPKKLSNTYRYPFASSGGYNGDWLMKEVPRMTTIVWGVVKDGLIVPSSSLPEGARVEIRLCDSTPDVPPELQAEFEGWDRASAEALALAERLAREGETSGTS
jgi:hypothetical protein